jgi:DNA-binding transcriptional LysR family regulator
MLRAIILTLLLVVGSWATHAEDLDKIKTIVVIYAENRSFDHLYGFFPGANGIASATVEQKTQLDHDGTPLLYLTMSAPTADQRNFTKAAAKLGVSQSAPSHTIKELEARLGVRLLTRTTRSVSPTEAGERLMGSIGPRFDEIEGELKSVAELREKRAGTVRITATKFAIDILLLARLAPLLRAYPDIKIELIVDYGLTDIVAQQYDVGVRSGEQVARDMIAVRIGPDMRMAVVGAPSCFKGRSEPKEPQDLVEHNCINLRLPSTAMSLRGNSRRAAVNSRSTLRVS